MFYSNALVSETAAYPFENVFRSIPGGLECALGLRWLMPLPPTPASGGDVHPLCYLRLLQRVSFGSSSCKGGDSKAGKQPIWRRECRERPLGGAWWKPSATHSNLLELSNIAMVKRAGERQWSGNASHRLPPPSLFLFFRLLLICEGLIYTGWGGAFVCLFFPLFFLECILHAAFFPFDFNSEPDCGTRWDSLHMNEAKLPPALNLPFFKNKTKLSLRL